MKPLDAVDVAEEPEEALAERPSAGLLQGSERKTKRVLEGHYMGFLGFRSCGLRLRLVFFPSS